MNKAKMSLANLQGKMSRAEMKSIMAGSGGGGGANPCMCDTDSECSYHGTGYYCSKAPANGCTTAGKKGRCVSSLT